LDKSLPKKISTEFRQQVVVAFLVLIPNFHICLWILPIKLPSRFLRIFLTYLVYDHQVIRVKSLLVDFTFMEIRSRAQNLHVVLDT